MSRLLFGFAQPWLDPWSWAPRGGDDGGGGGGGGGDDSSSSSSSSTKSSSTKSSSGGTRSEADIQKDINDALSASGGQWTSELNDLVSERDVARSGGGGGGTSAPAGGGTSAGKASTSKASTPAGGGTTFDFQGPMPGGGAGYTQDVSTIGVDANTGFLTGDDDNDDSFSIGYGAGQIDPGLAAAAGLTTTSRSQSPAAASVAASFEEQAEQDDRASQTGGGYEIGYGVGQIDPGLAAAAGLTGASGGRDDDRRSTAATFDAQAEQDDRGSTTAGLTGAAAATFDAQAEQDDPLSFAPTGGSQPSDNVSNELTALQEQLVSLNDNIALMQDQDLVDQGLITALTQERDSLRTQFDDLNTTYDALNTEIGDSRATISNLSTQIDDLNNNIAVMQDQDLVDQGLINALNDQKSTLETERSTLQTNLGDLTSSYDLLNDTYAGTVVDLDAANTALSDTKSILGTTQSTLDETSGLLTASRALNASLAQQTGQTPPASTQNLSRIGDIDPSTVGVYANAPRSSAPAPASVDYASLFDLTPEQEADFRAGATAPSAGTSIDVLSPLGRPTVQGSDLTGNLVSSTMRTGQMAGRAIQSGAEAIAPQSTATIGYGQGQVDPALAAAAGYGPNAPIAVGEPNVVSQFGGQMAESFDRLAGRALSNTSPENREAAVADIYDPETGLNLDALGTQLALSAVPSAAALSGLAFGLPGVMLTGGAMQMGETAQQTLDNIDAAYARGELGPINEAQLNAMKSRALEVNAPISAATGAVTNAIYGSGLGIPAKVALGVVEGAFDEAVLEPSIARTAANIGTGQGGVQGEIGSLNEAIIGATVRRRANVLTGAGVGSQGTTAGQGPSVMSQGPGQPGAPTMPGGPGTSVTSPAASAIAGAPLTARTAPAAPVAQTVPGAPVVQTTAPGAPVTPTTPSVIQIPGTDITVNTNLPQLPGPEAPPPALGTGGTFTPGRPSQPAADTAPQVDTTPPTSMDRMSTAADIINTEVAETGALSNDTAQSVAQEYNLSMQDVANLAEEAMGVTPSEAAGPSTALTTTTPTEVVVSETQPTGIATITSPQTQPEGYVFDGEILGPETEVSTEVLPEEEGVIIEGEVPSTEVVVSPRPRPRPTETVVTPAETTVLPTDTGVVVFPDTADMGGDDEEVVVEVDDTPPTDTGGDGEEVVVEVGESDETECPEGYELQEVNGEMICVPIEAPIEAPFECPEGYEAVQINGQWRCQATQAAPQRVRPRAGPYYRPNPNPAYTTRGS
jgi:predicted  nucleic acid-binding Zn-ribbon protein